MTQLVKMTSSSCGCGGSSSGGCGCGGSGGCTVSGDGCMEGAIERPVFFSGQLLTEEDLQQLSDYAAVKFRLHNRFLHGSGVVCGLLVTCNPCGGGKVTVQPGTALDCCGNDIHLPCAVELDINKMVAGLRLELRGGHDCGDPCAKECADSPDDEKCLDRKGRRYDLYLRYCETLVDPVAPYVTGGDCAPQACKPTRINEGYRFELRCPSKDPEPDDLFHRIAACIGDLYEAEKAANDTHAAELYGKQHLAAHQYIGSGQSIAFATEDAAAIDEVAQLATVDGSKSAVAMDQGKLNQQYDTYLAGSAAVLRYDLQSEQARKELESGMPGIEQRVSTARRAIQASGTDLKARAGMLDTARARLMAETLVEQGMALTALAGQPADQTQEYAMKSYSMGAPQSAKVFGQFGRDLAQRRDWLLSRIEGKVLSSDCRLRTDLLKIDIPDESKGDRTQLAEASRALKLVLLRYLVDCICAALNPPCQPCEDPAVKLAGLTVEDCEVTKICNLERTFVLSGPALRYWVPFLHMIGELFERACCDFEFKFKQAEVKEELPPRVPPQPSVVGYMAKSAQVSSPGDTIDTFSSMFRMAGIDPQKLRSQVNFGADIGRLSLPLDGLRQRAGFGIDLAGAAIKREVVGAVREDSNLHEEIAAPMRDEISILRNRVDNLSSEVATEAAVDKSLGGIRKEVEALSKRSVDAAEIRELRKEVVALGKRAIDPVEVRELRKALDGQIKANERLVERLVKLETKKGA
jgi:hypothetical protein